MLGIHSKDPLDAQCIGILAYLSCFSRYDLSILSLLTQMVTRELKKVYGMPFISITAHLVYLQENLTEFSSC
jgi:hypothetical protein